MGDDSRLARIRSRHWHSETIFCPDGALNPQCKTYQIRMNTVTVEEADFSHFLLNSSAQANCFLQILPSEKTQGGWVRSLLPSSVVSQLKKNPAPKVARASCRRCAALSWRQGDRQIQNSVACLPSRHLKVGDPFPWRSGFAVVEKSRVVMGLVHQC